MTKGKNYFGEAIRQVMEHKGHTAYSLAKASGVRNTRLYALFSGAQAFPSFKSFFKLSKTLGYKRPDKFLTEICNIIEYLHKKDCNATILVDSDTESV